MAYNPGVVDRSGEILAQSRLSAGNALLQGLTGGIETYRKNRLQNQLLTGENDALLAGLQQLQGMGGAAIDNLAPAGMGKLIEKHTKGGGLGLNESMQLNAMLNTTLKTAQAGQKLQADALNQRVLNQQLENEIFKGQQAQKDVTGLGKALKEISAIENPSQTQIFDILSKQDLSPAAMNQFGEIFKGTLARTAKPATGTEALYQSRRQAFIEKSGRAPTAAEDAEIRQGSIEAGRAQSTTNIGTGFAGQLFTDLNKKKSDIFALREVLANYDTAIDEVSKGGISGPGGEIKFQGARALQAFGINAFKSEAEAYQAAGSALAASALSMARMLPGSFTEKELVFLNNVVSGAEKVPSLDALKQLRSRFASRLERQEKVFESEVNAFGEASKEDPNIKIGFRILSAKPSAEMPSLPPNF
jgi:hypothetical protein